MENGFIGDLKFVLHRGVVEVRFRKVNGDERVMNCTLNTDIVPKYEGTTTRKKNDNVLCVWDVDANGWRSFRLDSVSQFNFTF